MIIDITTKDAPSIAEIYNHYIKSTTITFEIETVSISETESRIAKIHDSYPYIGWLENDQLCGYAYANKFRERKAYDGSVETTIYLKKDMIGRGIGKKLYSDLLPRLGRMGFHRAFGLIALPNKPSVDLHEKMGFKKVGHLEEVGCKFDAWIDVGFWQKALIA
jgi:L-amino acid N-acyltransferase YncA